MFDAGCAIGETPKPGSFSTVPSKFGGLERHSRNIRPGPGAPTNRRPVGGLPKRCFDLIVSLIAILCFAPMLILVAAIIRYYDGGPVLFRHRRLGYNAVEFDCFKFRTMVANSDEVLRKHLDGNDAATCEWKLSHKLKNDPRVTTLGAILRKTSLDELPQLFNIIKGEMSFVGPRPIVTAEIPKYGTAISHYYNARPGLTGIWQISGRNDVSYETRVTFDREYVARWRFANDLKIMIKTAGVVLRSHGCY